MRKIHSDCPSADKLFSPKPQSQTFLYALLGSFSKWLRHFCMHNLNKSRRKNRENESGKTSSNKKLQLQKLKNFPHKNMRQAWKVQGKTKGNQRSPQNRIFAGNLALSQDVGRSVDEHALVVFGQMFIVKKFRRMQIATKGERVISPRTGTGTICVTFFGWFTLEL